MLKTIHQVQSSCNCAWVGYPFTKYTIFVSIDPLLIISTVIATLFVVVLITDDILPHQMLFCFFLQEILRISSMNSDEAIMKNKQI
jgi:hypothetical protein